MTSVWRGLLAMSVLAVGLVAQSDFRLSGLSALHADVGGRVELEVCLEVPTEFHLLVDGELRTPRFELSGADEIRWEWGEDPAPGATEIHNAYRRVLTGELPDRELETELVVTAYYMPCTGEVCHAPQEVRGTCVVRVGPAQVDRTGTILWVGAGVALAILGLLWFCLSRWR